MPESPSQTSKEDLIAKLTRHSDMDREKLAEQQTMLLKAYSRLIGDDVPRYL